MIISKSYAKKLIIDGKAGDVTQLKPDNNGDIYISVTRYDIQRTDHYLNN